MRDTLKKQEGITLATLVLTIIVLLILAGVSITYSVDSMDHSKYMAMLSEIQIVQERINLYYSEGKVILESNLNNTQKTILQNKGVSSEKYSNYYYFTNTDLRALLDMDSIEGEYLISVVDRDVICLSTIKRDGEQINNYRLNDITSGFDVEYIETKLSKKASIGDYVNYDPTSGGNVTSANTTYTSVKGSTTAHGNGYGSQKFSASNYKNAGGKWRILDIDGSGAVTLISDLIYEDSGTGMGTTGFYLSNGLGYIWAEEELHRIASIYGHGKGADTSKIITYYYGGPNDQDGSIAAGTVEAQQGRKAMLSLSSGARSLTVEDINKICGHDSTYTANYSSEIVTKVSNNARYYPTISTTNTTTGQSTAQSTFSGSYYKTYYYYSISSANSDTDAQTNQNSMLKLGTNYLLASRCVYADSGSTVFSVRYVDSSGNVYGSNPCYCYRGSWTMITPSYGVRSVITLKSGIQTSDASYPGDEVGWNLAD